MPILTQTPFPNELVERQAIHIITQTIVQETSTYTTVLTLGTVPTDTGTGGPPSNTGTPSGDGGGVTSVELGAILGGITAFVVIALFICICCSKSRRRARVYEYEYDSYETSYAAVDVPASRLRRPPPVAERVPGGPKFPTYRAIPIPNPRTPTVQYTTR